MTRSPRPHVTPPSVTRSLSAPSTTCCGDCELTGYRDISSTWSGYVSSGQYQNHYRKKNHDYMKNNEYCYILFRRSALLSAYNLHVFLFYSYMYFSYMIFCLTGQFNSFSFGVRALPYGDISIYARGLISYPS